ncbi:hypothetical protein OEZ85_003625 [Tetradesmus obliquus]|uniref:Nucleoprotein TPR/MLP1 domain-containing protein n=1 Tax=Tetradesmus obliquus TaxID=3088 RepID=A0ABY8UBX7_TETOB|nr:hypothetical protein OEZ85_003625 [Tetradesmus obliquus]
MEFHPRPQAFTGHELAELVAISPDDAAMKLGFQLQDPEVDDVVRAARDLEAGCIEPDTSLSAEENVELLLRATRLLQLGLEVQFTEAEGLLSENNGLRNDLRALEDQNRALDEEVADLRELRDREGMSADVREMEHELKELRHDFEEERRANEKLIEQSDKDKQTIDSLEAKLQRADELMKIKDDETLDLREQLSRLRDDFDELRGQYAALTASGSSKEQQREMGDTIRQQEWKIERLTKDNRALEASNCELRAQLETVKEENLQVSEKIILLDSEARELRLAAAQADDRAEVLTREKGQLGALAEELRADVAAKMALLDEFEDRFNRQYRSWEEERSSLTSQIEALRREARLYTSSKGKAARGSNAADAAGAAGAGSDAASVDEDDASPEVQLAALRRALDEAKENEVLLLEAYEQLEADVGQEVDRALAKQADELSRLARRVQFLEGHLEAERHQVALLGEEGAKLEGRLADASAKNAQYESGVYGLPQAALEIRQLKETIAARDARVQELVQQVNKLSAALEDLSDEAVLLRRKAGLPQESTLDTSGVKLQKDVTIAQLRSVNALLERQVSDLEEERRKLRLEVKFRAKYHGRAALEMGLSPEQLLLLEEYVEGLKGGRQPEERLVTQLQQRIEFLEVRLAEVMAYADIPINMRPALTELTAGSMQAGFGAVAAAGMGQLGAAAAGALAYSQQLMALHGAQGVREGAVDGAGGVAGSIKATQVELVRGALLGCLKMLRQMSEALDDNFVADAAAEELRERLKQLAKQVVDMQVSLAQKDAQLDQLAQHKAALEARMGLTGGKDAAAVAAAAVAARRGADYVSREQHEEVELELDAVKEQLLECLEELGARERELSEVNTACVRYQSSMAEVSDQVKMLYRDYANNAANWRLERSSTEKQLKKARAEAADASSQLQAVEKALKALEAGDMDDIKRQYIDAVRKAAVVQLKHAKLARQLEASTAAEKAAAERLEELQEELQDVSSTCRGRIRWLEQAAADAARRTQQLYRCLQGAAPLEAYQALVDKHSQLSREHRLLLEHAGDAAVSSQVEELLAVRQQLAELLPRYDEACNKVAELREQLRQLELPTKLSSKPSTAFISGSGSMAAKATAASAAASVTAAGSAAAVVGDDVRMALNQDLVAAMVKLEGMARRLEMAEREKDRMQASLSESQAHAAELEHRLAQVSAELSTSRALEGRLQQRLAASVPAAQLEEMAARLDAAEAAAKHEGGAMAALLQRAEAAEAKATELSSRRQRQLADITNLRATVRELSSTSDAASQLGKLHAELDHVRAKEGLARSALNRSELERLELESQARRLKQQVASLTVQLSVAQDHGRWAESELLESLTRLELGLAGHVEAWKASRWAAKLEQLKQRNDALADGMAAAVRRLAASEDGAHEAQLRCEMTEDVRLLLSRGVSEVHREAAALKEQQLVLKLEAGKLTRAELLMRQKVGYLERVNAELCELLEKCDAEALSQQGSLTAEKRELTSRMRQLQEEVVRLHDRSSALLAELEEHKAARSSRGAAAGAARAMDQSAAPSEAAARAAACAADKELMLKQIDSLKEARTEAEHMRQECHSLQAQLERKQAQLQELQATYDDVLERLKGQSTALLQALGNGGGMAGAADETALAQLRAVAEAAIRELQAKVKDREEQLEQATAKLQEHQAAYLAQHAKDRSEIEALNNKLFESGAASIAGLKANLARATAVLAATGDGREEVPYEQLRLLLEERSAEAEVLRTRLEQREASLEINRKHYEQQAQRQDAEIQRLTAALAAAPREDSAAPNTRQALQKMAAEVRLKDERLRQLRGAIKALEGKLAQLLKDKTDLVMQASSWLEQEQLDERMAELEAQKAALAADLQAAHAELAAARQAAAVQDATLRKLSEQLLKEGEAAAKLKVQLAREQGLVKSLRAKMNKAMTNMPEGSQQQLQLQVVQLQQRISELEQEQQQLQHEPQHSQAGGLAAESSDGAAASKSGGVSYASQQWEESKQLQARIDSLRKKLAKRGEELESLQKECDRRCTLLGSITAEKEKLAAALAATQAKLRRVGQEAAAAAAEPVLKADAAKVPGADLGE